MTATSLHRAALAGLLLGPLAACESIEGEGAAADTKTQEAGEVSEAHAAPRAPMSDTRSDGLQLATFGAGCFWCVEAVYDQIEGVSEVRSGYAGGETEDPTYEEVCTGTTGHAEVCELAFDPAVISYEELLDWFWRLHDPTTLNRQGADVGTQYRSAIFYHSEVQREAAERSKQEAQASFADPIVTEITPASTFYVAEAKHQDYYFGNQGQGYCRMVIKPKLKKLGLEY